MRCCGNEVSTADDNINEHQLVESKNCINQSEDTVIWHYFDV